MALRILIADDFEDCVEGLSLLLRLCGHLVATALNGRMAVLVSSEFHPDVVLMDLDMPELNGYEAALRIRERSASPILLIAMSGFTQEEERKRVFVAGFDAFLAKPFDMAALSALLQSEPPL
jgi:CheY-like chemotaxis protein